MAKKKKMMIDDVEYVRADSVTEGSPAEKVDGMNYVIIRTYSAGVHAGYLKEREGKEVVLLNARRLWYWKGAASISQLSVDGVSSPSDCKFPCEVGQITLTEAIEVIPCTEKARLSIKEVAIWRK